jgi:hypothetical protein
VAPEVTIDFQQVGKLFRIAFAEMAGATAPDAELVVWVNGEDELLVRIAGIRLVLRDGFLIDVVRDPAVTPVRISARMRPNENRSDVAFG